MTETVSEVPVARPKDWTNILFLSLTPVIGVFGTLAYALKFGVTWWEPVLFLASYLLVGLSVTAGYHRLYAHKGYEAHPLVHAFFLFFGAMALQNSVLKWASDHRIHHKYVDRDWDPYSIKRGGLSAHIFWLFYKDAPDRTFDNAPDLQNNRLVMLQYRYAAWIGILFGLGIPTLIGAAFGRPLGGLLWGGFLRIVVIHHTTFFVNSIAHMWGSRPYSDENSARDNWMLAFVTNGEGFHNFHHKFPSDYRNGIRWFDWDPTKWLIRSLHAVGLAKQLRYTPRPIIEKARLRMATLEVQSRLPNVPAEIGEAVRLRLDQAAHFLERASTHWTRAQEKKRAWQERGRERSSALLTTARRSLRAQRACLLRARAEWRGAVRTLSRTPEQA
ncbi:MAG: acyl-CoA desaturase [Acidobacteriota bacterium]